MYAQNTLAVGLVTVVASLLVLRQDRLAQKSQWQHHFLPLRRLRCRLGPQRGKSGSETKFCTFKVYHMLL